MRIKILALMCCICLAVLQSPADTITIYQTNEEEPNGTLGTATPLNDNTGLFPCAFQWNLDDDIYVFTTTVPNCVITVEAQGTAYVTDTALAILDSTGNELIRDDDSGTFIHPYYNGKITNFTLSAAGTYYIWVWEATNGYGAGFYYKLSGQIVEPATADTSSPTYSSSPGVSSATRTDPTTVHVTWNQATDDTTSQSNIQYNVYFGTSQAGLFSGAPQKTVTGALSTDITGLDPALTYYFGVRAEDQAGNQETNTVALQVEPLTAANPAVWTLYQ